MQSYIIVFAGKEKKAQTKKNASSKLKKKKRLKFNAWYCQLRVLDDCFWTGKTIKICGRARQICAKKPVITAASFLKYYKINDYFASP